MELKLVHPDATAERQPEKMIVVINGGNIQISFAEDGSNSNENLSSEELKKFGNEQVFENEIFSRIDNAVELEQNDQRKTMLTILKGFVEEKVKNASM